jgi:hypothetical protein
MILRTLFIVLTFGATFPAFAQNGEVWKTPNCGCCAAWIKHMADKGYTLKVYEMASGELAKLKQSIGVPPNKASCHTAKIDGYVIEGHVPAEDVDQLLREKPDAVGLSVPGMPVGSPGMEAGDQKDPYEVLLIKKDGTTDVFSTR